MDEASSSLGASRCCGSRLSCGCTRYLLQHDASFGPSAFFRCSSLRLFACAAHATRPACPADGESDRRIQAAIRHAFTGSTMLVVAHRLNTIIDSDAILVMDAGRCSEFGHPHELLAKGAGASIFAALVEETGPQSASALRAAAAAAYAKTRPDGAAEPAAPETVVAVAAASAPRGVADDVSPAPGTDAASVSVSVTSTE